MKSQYQLSLLLAMAFTLSACSGGGDNNNNSSPPAPAPPPATTPPVVDTAFTAFVLGLIGQSSDSALPVDINSTNFTFTEDANAFNSVLGGP